MGQSEGVQNEVKHVPQVGVTPGRSSLSQRVSRQDTHFHSACADDWLGIYPGETPQPCVRPPPPRLVREVKAETLCQSVENMEERGSCHPS